MTVTETIRKEIFEFDNYIFKEFESHYIAQTNQFINNMNLCYSEFIALKNNIDDKYEMLSPTIFYALTTLLHSFKFYCHGYQIPSGNLIRHCIEAIGLAIYATNDASALNQLERINISANKCINLLNRKRLQKKLNIDNLAVNTLTSTYKYYCEYSHFTMTSLSTCFEDSNLGYAYVGGSFDIDKKDVYDFEIGLRVSLSRDLPSLIAGIRKVIA